ncbi:UDP-N-acetylmuramoyl-L-alanine--D-glutamate ligase [Caldicellulosiruptoraceae bacterium PP1]
MNVKNKIIAVVGAAKSGISVCRFLVKNGAKVLLFDAKSEDKFTNEEISKLKSLGVELYLGEEPDDCLENINYIVLSPGVPADKPFISKAKKLGIEVIGEVELAYRYCKSNKIIAITGTNGKTTTTTLTTELLKNAGYNVKMCGNIGVPFIDCVEDSSDGDVFVLEISSFQLETIEKFKPYVAAILNITPDHLDRHKTLSEYINAKLKIFSNMDNNCFSVLNMDNSETKMLIDDVHGKLIKFSKWELNYENSVYSKAGIIYIKYNNKVIPVMNVSDIFIPGEHNLENALAAIACTLPFNIPPDVIRETLRIFKGVEHRIEYITTLNKRKFYNDSKGTNTDAAIKALNSFKNPIILIAGGYDKGEDFDNFAQKINEKVKHVMLIGTTAKKISDSLEKINYKNYTFCTTLKEAVIKAYEVSKEEDIILLSPACASWDMFENYEQRGRLFKEYVLEIERSL